MQHRLLNGTYECSLDNRFRMAIPARVRDRFSSGATVGWWFDGCLAVLPTLEWPDLIERTFGEMDVLNDDQRELSRFLLAGSYDQELDRQGRILLPQDLREYAGLGGKVKVVGSREYLEIWDPERLAERFAVLHREGVSSVAQRLAGRV